MIHRGKGRQWLMYISGNYKINKNKKEDYTGRLINIALYECKMWSTCTVYDNWHRLCACPQPQQNTLKLLMLFLIY